ncbi:MAG: lamin tail domain-containing protein, partial [Planctomycetota bacterium]
NRFSPEGFTWYRHDAEHSLGANGGVNEGRLLTDTTDRSIGQQWRHFNPAWLHIRLTDNPEYLMQFADRVNMYLSNGGFLTAAPNIQRWTDRANQIDLAIIAESARWGDAQRHPPRTKNDWEGQNNYMVNTFFPARTRIVINQMRSVDMFPNAALVSFNQHGGEILPGFELLMSQSNGVSGTIYYTLDGSDPRRPGALDSTSITLIPENADKRVLVPGRPIGDNWKNATAFNDLGWLECSGSPGGVGYERSSGYGQLITLDLEEQMYGKATTCYIRTPFTLSGNPDEFNSMMLKIRYDDGFIAYVNGTEVARRHFNGTPSWNSNAGASHSDSAAVQFESIDISGSIAAFQRGDNLLAVHGLNTSATSSDLLISVELIADKGGPSGSETSLGANLYTGPITLPHSANVKARVLSGRAWSALSEAAFAVGPVMDNLRITEIMYRPQNPDEEFIELANIGVETINLNLVSFTDGIDFTFSTVELASGEHVVIVRDRGAFESRYGTNVNVAGQYLGGLNNAGEAIRLEDAIGRTILDFRYRDGWRSLTDGEGFSLTIVDPTNPDRSSWDEKDSWRASAFAGGSPGQDDSGILPNPGAVVINEVLAHSHDEASDWIELYNTTGTAIDIGGWFLSDSKDRLFKYEIAGGTIIEPHAYLVFQQDLNFGNANDPGVIEAFALSENGEQLYLSSAQNGMLTGYRDVQDFGASATGVAFGRYYKSSTGNYNFVAMDHNTPDSANAQPKVGPIVISEIMYNPDWPVGSPYTNDQYEYVELYNISAEPVTLYSDDNGESWKFTDGIEFVFPSDLPVIIPAGEYLLAVKNPAAFSWRYPTVPLEKILGPYDGKLSNAGEKVELGIPGDLDESGERHYIRIDRVAYNDGSLPEDSPDSVNLWPAEADGRGKSLTRKILADYGNDPDNWFASSPSPGW